MLDRNYMYWSYQSNSFRAQFESAMTGLSVPHLSGPQIGDYQISLPDLNEQRQIARKLDDAHIAQSRSIETLTASIGLLWERKSALITAAVTGEFDVSSAGPRAAAAVTG